MYITIQLHTNCVEAVFPPPNQLDHLGGRSFARPLTLSSDLNLDCGSLDQTEAPSASSKAFRNPAPTSRQICGWYRGGVVLFLSGLANRSPCLPPFAGGMWLHIAYQVGQQQNRGCRHFIYLSPRAAIVHLTGATFSPYRTNPYPCIILPLPSRTLAEGG